LEITQKNQLRTLAGDAVQLQSAEKDLREQSNRLTQTRDQLELKKQAGRELENSLGNELRELQRSRTKLNQKLIEVQRSTQLLELQRQETAQAQSAIQTMIGQVARGEPVTGIPLSLLKGKLPWPAQGKVIQDFGMVKNRDLATTTDNPGIDIGLDVEAEVRTIAAGRVTSVTWLRGFGNVCIVTHPGEFYSVYARLGHVHVGEGDSVDDQSIIGTAGYDPQAEQYKVHFELWSGKEKKNPREWLMSRP
jgi:septal ring factor EnvC (AmiA/AmiB activator)